MLILTAICFLMSWVDWICNSTSIKFPAAWLLLILVKTAADCSLTLKQPDDKIESKVVQYFSNCFMRFLFYSNLDLITATCLMAFLFAFDSQTKIVQIIQSTISSIALLLAVLTLFISQLTYSYSVCSAVLGVFFSYVFSSDIQRIYESWNELASEPPKSNFEKNATDAVNQSTVSHTTENTLLSSAGKSEGTQQTVVISI